MMADLDDKWVQQFGKDAVDALVGVKREITLDIWRKVVRSTPVDTGRARHGWVATAGYADTSVSQRKVRRKEGAKRRLFPNQRPKNLQSTTLEADNFVVNNVEYIGDLNEGSSRQAPAGFVEAAVQSGVRQGLRIARRHLRKNNL
jgi:hypothetical protein